MKKNGMLILIALIMSVFIAVPAHAAVQAAIGGQNTSSEYHFTVDDDGLLKGSSTSTVQLTTNEEIVTSSDTDIVMVAADNGKRFISEAGEITNYTLPACGTDPFEVSVGAADAYSIVIDTDSTSDTISYLTLDAGDAIGSNSAIGDSVTLSCYKANTWVPVRMGSSAWVDAGID